MGIFAGGLIGVGKCPAIERICVTCVQKMKLAQIVFAAYGVGLTVTAGLGVL